MLNLATYNNSPDRSTKSTPSSINALWLLVNTGFQVLFHSPPGVLFTFPSRYCFTIGHQLVFRLGRWSSLLPTGFHVPRGTPDTSQLLILSHTGLLPSLDPPFQMVILLKSRVLILVHYPNRYCYQLVWPLPRSLATTDGITFVFFSCRYLDVSVPYVSPHNTMYSCYDTYALTISGFPHSEIYGSMDICSSP